MKNSVQIQTPPQSFLDLPVHGGSFNRYIYRDYGSIKPSNKEGNVVPCMILIGNLSLITSQAFL